MESSIGDRRHFLGANFQTRYKDCEDEGSDGKWTLRGIHTHPMPAARLQPRGKSLEGPLENLNCPRALGGINKNYPMVMPFHKELSIYVLGPDT